MVAHLKLILPKVINPTQSAFVPDRLITDNVLMVYECFNTITNKREDYCYNFCSPLSFT
jgi:hypothetical protein